MHNSQFAPHYFIYPFEIVIFTNIFRSTGSHCDWTCGTLHIDASTNQNCIARQQSHCYSLLIIHHSLTQNQSAWRSPPPCLSEAEPWALVFYGTAEQMLAEALRIFIRSFYLEWCTHEGIQIKNAIFSVNMQFSANMDIMQLFEHLLS